MWWPGLFHGSALMFSVKKPLEPMCAQQRLLQSRRRGAQDCPHLIRVRSLANRKRDDLKWGKRLAETDLGGIYLTSESGIVCKRSSFKGQCNIECPVMELYVYSLLAKDPGETHPNILRCYGYDRSPIGQKVDLFLEAADSDLYQMVVAMDYKSDLKVTLRAMESVLKGMVHLRSLGIAYMDASLENTFVFYEKNARQVKDFKIGDFGSSRSIQVGRGQWVTGARGKNNYMAPEMLVKVSGGSEDPPYFDPFKADIWSVGVIGLIMCFASFPYRTLEKEASEGEAFYFSIYELLSGSPFEKIQPLIKQMVCPVERRLDLDSALKATSELLITLIQCRPA